ncbi:MAG: protein kinase [Gemmatimonadetes bacterium]|nr:protein kinase [Gemmatimonadota bacterium]
MRLLANIPREGVTLLESCPKCGAPVLPDSLFCNRCGRDFTKEMSAAGLAATLPAAPVDDAADPAAQALAEIRAALAGRYEVQRVLGRGGMATVYLARDEKHDREVAIKVLHPELAASLGGERFEREIKLAAKLQHPHILGLYDSGVAGALLYYVMPFVKGESLRDRLDRDGMLPVEDAVRITLEVCDALGYAHAQGIIHRDIKPENILLQGEHALVADFGIARAVSEAGTQKLTQTGMAVGTPVYMAPEQSSGESVGPTADLYSLGCVLYEMLAGEPPFTGPNPMAIMARHLMEQVPSVRIVRSAVPEEVEQVIFAALGKMPVDRPRDAAQFAELMGLPFGSTATMRARGTPVMARRVTTGVQGLVALRRPWWRRPRVATAVAIAALALGGGSWALLGGKGSASAPNPNARRVAVLYFQDQSKDSSLAALADGLTEGLIRSLSSAPSLTVISRSGVERYRSSPLGPDSIARALRAGYLVRGEVEREGDKVRVSLRLDDASGVNVKRASFAVPAGNLFAMRDTLAVVASDLIRQQLGAEIQVKEQHAGTENPAAWLLLQRGEQARRSGEAANARGDTAGLNREFLVADSLYAAAEKTDPTWGDPAALRALLAYRRSRLAGGNPALIRQWIEVGVGHADHAIAIDPSNADAYETRGNLKYWIVVSAIETDDAKRQAALLAARTDLEKATTLNRNQAGAFATLSHLYYNAPGFTPTDVSIAAQQALAADEFLSSANLILARLFNAAYDLEQFDKAEQWCHTARQRFPADVRAVRCQLYLLTAKPVVPNVAEAWRLADTAVMRVPPAARPRERMTEDMLVAAVIARASKTQPALADSARHVARRSEGTAQSDPTRDLAFFGAFVYTLLGDKDEAIRLLKEYLAANPSRAASLRSDPGWYFKPLEGDVRFRQLVGATP